MRAAGRVAIGVCTAHRPEMLKCCLAALAAQIIPQGIDVTLVVADKEPEPNNQPAVEEFAGHIGHFPVVYAHEPRRASHGRAPGDCGAGAHDACWKLISQRSGTGVNL